MPEALQHFLLHPQPVPHGPELPMLRHDGGRGMQQRGQPIRCIRLTIGGAKRCLHVGEALLEDRVQHGGLAVEVVVEQSRRDAGRIGNRIDRCRGVAAAGKQLQCSIEKFCPRDGADFLILESCSWRHFMMNDRSILTTAEA